MQDVDAMGTYYNGRGNPLCVHRNLVYSYERHYGRPARVFFYSLIKKVTLMVIVRLVLILSIIYLVNNNWG